MERHRLATRPARGPTRPGTPRSRNARNIPGPAGAARPGAGRPRSAATHAAILDAAIALVREIGFDATTMEAIAARAGAGKATLYRRWTGKETLVAEAIQRLMSDAMRVPDTGSNGGDVRVLMRVAQGMYADPATPMLLSGLVAAMARSKRIAAAVRGSFVASWRGAMRAVLKRGVQRGEVRRGVDLELALDLLAGPPFHRALIGGLRPDDAFMTGVADLVLRALAPSPRPLTGGPQR